MMVFNPFGYLIRPIGYAIMMLAFSKLKDYRRDFLYTMIVSFFMLVLSCILAVDGLFPLFAESTRRALGYIEMLGSFVFHGTLWWAIRAIAKETEVEKISFAATRNFIFFGAYNLLYFIAVLPFPFAAEYAKIMSVPVLLLYFACPCLSFANLRWGLSWLLLL